MSNIYLAKGKSLEDQYNDVGRLFAAQLQQTKLGNATKKVIAKKVLTWIKDEPMLTKFYRCFAAWAKGGEIEELTAMYLLVDNLEGCQTMMVRYKNGVGMIHTEEDFDDPIARMKGEHTIEFNDNGRRLVTLTYNNLMPGCALYGWQKNMLVAVDALFLREDGLTKIEKPMLSNIVGWLIWQLTPEQADAEQIVAQYRKLGELVDGYAVNVVRKIKGRIQGYKITFARGDWEIERLGSKVGVNLRQVNILEPHYVGENRLIMEWQPRELVEDYWAFILRLQVLAELGGKYGSWLQQTIVEADLRKLHLAVYQLIYKEHRAEFVNEWMGAAMVGILDKSLGVSVSCKLNDERPLEEIEYLDQIV